MMFLQYLVAIFYGAIVGNFATTVYHRLPANKPLNGINNHVGVKPHCSKCGHQLKFTEYLPVLSWFSAPTRCNYCNQRKDQVYTFIELFGILSSLYFMAIVGLRYELTVFVLLSVNVLLVVLFFTKYRKVFIKNLALVIVLILGIMASNQL